MKRACNRCKGKGHCLMLIQNLGTKQFEEHIVPCQQSGCKNGIIDTDELCPNCHPESTKNELLSE